MGLGAGSATPLQMAAAYAIFANGGYRVAPYLIAKVTDAKGNVLSEAKPVVAGENAERAIDPRNAFVMTSLLRDVISFGTATRARSLGRKDLAGKTGTTNDNVDAWFCGYSTHQVGVAWIGYDQPKSLGSNETGSVAALPIWISYMQRALKGLPERMPAPADGLLSVRINADTGLRDDSGTVSEYFYAEFPPRAGSDALAPGPAAPGQKSPDVRDQLF
jgi:penicillin-binding protein 1A